jgi:hypothetical protein
MMITPKLKNTTRKNKAISKDLGNMIALLPNCLKHLAAIKARFNLATNRKIAIGAYVQEIQVALLPD